MLRRKKTIDEKKNTLPVLFNWYELRAISDLFHHAATLTDIAKHDRLMIAEINHKLERAGFYK